MTKTTKQTGFPILSLALCALLSLPLGEGWGGASFAQNIGINSTGATPDASALLDINAAPGNDKGLLIPRVALTATTSNAPIGAGIALSLMVYNTATVNDVTPGYYFWDGTLWQRFQNILPVPSNDWTLLGNAGTVDGTNFIGTTDNIPFSIRVNNINAGRIASNGPTFIGYQAGNSNTSLLNTGVGYQTLYSNTTGFENTANGYQALYSNIGAFRNTAIGSYSLYANTTGSYNTSSGHRSLNLNTTGAFNTAVGSSALQNNTLANHNTASGYIALYSNTTASQNTAIGSQALFTQSFSNGGVAWNSDNVAVGYNALYANQPTATGNGKDNTAIGNFALQANTTGRSNTANGYQALYSNTTGNENTAIGYWTLLNNTTGGYNSANGSYALYSNTGGNFNIAHGYGAMMNNSTGSHNAAIGRAAMNGNTTGDYNNALGHQALDGNNIGSYNTAMGTLALWANRAGSNATAIGARAMFYANNTATAFTNYNVAVGYEALRGSTTTANNTGNSNTALGYQTLWSNSSGFSGTATGRYSLYSNTSGTQNTGNGMYTLYFNATGYNNTALGYGAGYGANGVNFDNCTFVGASSYLNVARNNVTMLGSWIANAQCTGNDQVLLGNTSITSIRAQVTGITAYSDARFKLNVKEDVKGLDFIMKLAPVTYNEDPTILHRIWGTPDSLVNKIDHSDIKKQRFIGFLAQDVEKAAKESGFNFPGIDVPGNAQEVYTLRYVDFIMPMVKAVQELNEENKELKKQSAEMQKQIDELIILLNK